MPSGIVEYKLVIRIDQCIATMYTRGGTTSQQLGVHELQLPQTLSAIMALSVALVAGGVSC